MQHSVARRDAAPRSGAVDPDIVIAAELTERLRQSAAALLPCMARAAMQLSQAEAWKQHGFANVRDFARERLDRSGRWLTNLARLGQALHHMPELEASITGTDGHRPLGRTAAFEISRIATPATLSTWVHHARRNDIRKLQEMIRRELSAPSSGQSGEVQECEATRNEARRHERRTTMRMPAPHFVPAAFHNLERVYKASNPSGRQNDFVDVLVAEYSSGAGNYQLQDVSCTTSDSIRKKAPLSPAVASLTEEVADRISAEHIAGCRHKEFLLALWAEQHVQAFLARSADGKERRRGQQAYKDIQSALQLEHQTTLREDQLLLWIDHRNAWRLLGFADVGEFGRQVLDESASTLRNRLRIARAMEQSPALRSAVESGGLSRERLVRISRLLQQHKLAENAVRSWVEHASTITLKRLDDELGRHAQHRNPKPLPLNDQDWFDSLRLQPGDARHMLLSEGLRAIAAPSFAPPRVAAPSADVFLKLTLPVDTAATLRQCLNQARLHLHSQCEHMQTLSPAEEARLFPSIRLARFFHAGRRPIPDWVCLLAVLEEFAEQHDNPRHMQCRPTDRITIRDGWRCTAPGCTAREVEVHHIIYQSQGGSDAPLNLTSLCPFHHRMGEHGGLTRVTGQAPLQLHWRLGRDATAVEYHGERLLHQQVTSKSPASSRPQLRRWRS